MALASVSAGPSGVVNISMVEYRLQHLATKTGSLLIAEDGRRQASENVVYVNKTRRYAEDYRTFNCTHLKPQ